MLGIIYTLAALAAMAGAGILIMASGIVRYVPNDKVGIVERLWSPKGSIVEGVIALNGEAGYQPDLLRGGFHFFFPFMYRLHIHPLITIRSGTLGYVFARSGKPLMNGQILASNASVSDFGDVRGFLLNGGQQGAQRRILMPGTYPINVAQFVVLTAENAYHLNIGREEQSQIEAIHHTIESRGGFTPVVIMDRDDILGVVTVHDGPALPSGEIIAAEVGTDPAQPHYHNSFQDPEAFLAAGGNRGKQLQVIVDGTYAINRLFATVDTHPKVTIPVGQVGVVVSYTGKTGVDVSDANYRHGELVRRGFRGVWDTPLLTGKYAWNPLAGKITNVPTSNIVLKWKKDASGGDHNLDQNLSEITLITKDAFQIIMSLSVVIHIDYQKAPELIQRFGDVQKLIEGTLDPIVSGYFKNVGQDKTILELLQDRTKIQAEALAAMKARFAEYTIVVEDVVVGTPREPEGVTGLQRILDQLRDRQVATEQKATFKIQEETANQEKALKEAQSIAAMQTALTESKIEIEVQENQGKATVASAKQEAERTITLAEANKKRLVLEGQGEGERLISIGEGEAKAGKAKVEAYGGAEMRLAEILGLRFFEGVEKGQIALVPQVQVGNSGGGSGVLDGLLAMFLQNHLNVLKSNEGPGAPLFERDADPQG